MNIYSSFKLMVPLAIALTVVVAQPAFGQASAPTKAQASSSAVESDETRMQRNDTSKAARRSGGSKATGETTDMKDSSAQKSPAAGKTRAERKAETRNAMKTGDLPAGQEPMPAPAAPKK